MNIADVIAIQLTLQNVSAVLSALERVSTQLATLDGQLRMMASAGAAFVAVAFAMAGAALAAYDGFARMQMGAEALLGVVAGDRFADALQKFAVQSAFPMSQVRTAGQFLLTTQGGEKTMAILRSLNNLAAAGGANAESYGRISYGLGQIGSVGSAQAYMLRREILRAPGGAVVLSETAKALGFLDKNGRGDIGRLQGLESDKFFQGLIKAGSSGNMAGMGEQLAMRSPAIALQNTLEAFMNALIPTGRILAFVVYWLTKLGQIVFAVFGFLNRLSFGFLGFAGIVYLAIVGFGLLVTWSRFVIGSFRTLWTSALGASAALRLVAGTASTGVVAKLIKDLGVIGDVILLVVGALVLLLGVVWALFKLVEWIVSLFGVNVKHFSDTQGANWFEDHVIDPIWDTVTGRNREEEAKAQKALDNMDSTSGNRPQRSSSWERIYKRGMGNAIGG